MLFSSQDFNTLNFLKNELEYINLHANKYQRVQRKNVKEYLRLRIEALEQHETDSKQVKEILNNENATSEQKNTE